MVALTLLVIVSLTTVIGVSILFLCWFRSITRKTIPFADLNVLNAVRGMTSPLPHLYLHKLSLRIQKRTFRLPLPIVYLKDFKFMGIIAFRLPALRRVFCVGNVDLARRILMDSLSDKPREIYASFEGITEGHSVLFTKSQNSVYTKSVRLAAVRAFSSRKNENVQDVIRHHVDEWINVRLTKLSQENKAFDPAEEALRITFSIICEVAFEYPASYQEFRNFSDNIDHALLEFAYRQSTNPLRKIFGRWIPSVRAASRAAQQVVLFAKQVLAAYRAKPLSKQRREEHSFLALLLQNPNIKTDDQLVSEIVMFLVGGHDTTGSAVGSVMTLLAKHPAVQEKLRNELLAQQNSNNTNLLLPYLRNVIKEANRLYPVAVMGSTRLTGRDFCWQKGEILPAKSICLMPQYLYYRDVTIFDNPNTFCPDRWDRATKEMNDATFPFSLGPRSCPGQNLAMEEIHQLVPRLIKRFSLELEQDSRPYYVVVLKHLGARIKVKAIIE